jgi:hypothetical protein
VTKPKQKTAKIEGQERKAKGLSAFRAEYDRDYIVPTKIKAALRMLGQGGWEYEVDFSRMAGVSLADLAAYRDKFCGYWVQVKRDGRRAWAGSAALAASMRKMV